MHDAPLSVVPVPNSLGTYLLMVTRADDVPARLMALFGTSGVKPSFLSVGHPSTVGPSQDLGGMSQHPVICARPAHRPRSLPATFRTWTSVVACCSELVARNSAEARELSPLRCSGRQNPNRMGWAIAQTPHSSSRHGISRTFHHATNASDFPKISCRHRCAL